MAIRPLKSIGELRLGSLSKLYRNCKEISSSHLFCNLLISGMEHLLIYCKGNNLEFFFKDVLSLIAEANTDDFRENYSDSFDDIESLFEKKKIKTLNSLVYDYSFLNLLLTLEEMFEVPEGKSSENENVYEIQYYSEKLKINILLISSKLEESKFFVDDAYVSMTILQNNQQFYIYYIKK